MDYHSFVETTLHKDSDAPGKSPKKRVGAANGPAAAGGLYTSGPLPQDLGGGPANLGKITSSSNALADTDPLGVNPNINFDAVGGLDTHIASLKEMTLLPLLYPEVFQRFGVTPPRGVLFHGPPGTGKTLMARALASSCRSDGRSISFFMRKGADCLSKWVGEAERQLRLLFEEARNSQPSIIFFDEIDGEHLFPLFAASSQSFFLDSHNIYFQASLPYAPQSKTKFTPRSSLPSSHSWTVWMAEVK
jgi:hypothetical protein